MTWQPQVPAGPALPKVPTGIRGLDAITGGGLPQGRCTLVTGGTGCGKTQLGLNFLVAGAREHGEPGVLVTFDESAEEVAANVASLGFDLAGLQKDGLLTVYAFRVEPTDIVGTGEFDFAPLSLLLDDAIKRIGARRVVLDTIEALFGAFQAQPVVRAELVRLFAWLKDRAVTTVVTGERGDGDALTRHGIEEYVSDCVIVLDHRIQNEVSTRRLRVVKYRGSAHQTNEYPFLITARGFSVPPVTAVTFGYGASDERISTGVPQLDGMLFGGLFRGSAVVVSGSPGAGKTTLGAHLIDAACARGERALLILSEESPGEVARNMRSVGLDLQGWVEAGLLRIWAGQSTEFGLDNHLAMVSGLVAEHAPAVAVIDGIGSLLVGHSRGEVTLMLARKFHLLKDRGITAMVTVVAEREDETAMGMSSRADTWLLLRTVESDGRRGRLLSVLKSRGMAHSDEVRELVLTDHGVELLDVYPGPGGPMTRSARLAQADRERRDQLAAERGELDQLAGREERLAGEAQASRRVLGARRWAGPDADDD